jgi:hypothetical protein
MCSGIDSRHAFKHVKDAATLAVLYEMARDHDVADRTFYDGSVQSAQDFITLAKQSQVFGVYLDRKIVGFGLLSNWSGRAVSVHVCLFPTARLRTTELGRDFLRFVLCGSREHYDCIFGLTPATHRHALIYAKRIGMKRAGVIYHGAQVGDQVTDLIITTVTRDDLGER